MLTPSGLRKLRGRGQPYSSPPRHRANKCTRVFQSSPEKARLLHLTASTKPGRSQIRPRPTRPTKPPLTRHTAFSRSRPRFFALFPTQRPTPVRRIFPCPDLSKEVPVLPPCKQMVALGVGVKGARGYPALYTAGAYGNCLQRILWEFLPLAHREDVDGLPTGC